MADVDETIEDEETEEDEDTSTDDTESEDEGGEDGDASDEDQEEAEGEESDDSEEDGEEDEGQSSSKGKKSSKSDADAEPVVPTRKLFDQQNIIARKNKTIDKLRKGEGDGEDDTSDDDDDLTPEAKSGVQKQVAKALKPVLDHISKGADETDLKDLYGAEPDAKKYDRAIRVYMKHPAYKGVPPAVIFHHLAFEVAQASGAKKKSIADKQAGKVRGAGNSKRSSGRSSGMPSPEEINKMTDAELETLQHDVRTGKFKA